jgi:CBS domain-containing protein
MKIKDRREFKTKGKVITVKPTDLVSKAVEIMSAKNIGAVVAVDKDNKVLGILTERDLMRRLLNAKLNPDKTKVSEIMTSEVRVASGDDSLLEWLQIMSNERFRHLPIVDDNGCLVNIMSQGDFVSYTWPELLGRVAENTKASFAGGRYQVFLIIAALLAYALLVKILA